MISSLSLTSLRAGKSCQRERERDLKWQIMRIRRKNGCECVLVCDVRCVTCPKLPISTFHPSSLLSFPFDSLVTKFACTFKDFTLLTLNILSFQISPVERSSLKHSCYTFPPSICSTVSLFAPSLDFLWVNRPIVGKLLLTTSTARTRELKEAGRRNFCYFFFVFHSFYNFFFAYFLCFSPFISSLELKLLLNSTPAFSLVSLLSSFIFSLSLSLSIQDKKGKEERR